MELIIARGDRTTTNRAFFSITDAARYFFTKFTAIHCVSSVAISASGEARGGEASASIKIACRRREGGFQVGLISGLKNPFYLPSIGVFSGKGRPAMEAA